MQIIVDGIMPNIFRKSLKDKIESKEIRTWTFVKEGRHERLLHTGDEQYEDVVIRIIPPSEEEQQEGKKYTLFYPSVRENASGKQAKAIAESHFGIVLGRFAEVLNCHYTAIGEYRTELE